MNLILFFAVLFAFSLCNRVWAAEVQPTPAIVTGKSFIRSGPELSKNILAWDKVTQTKVLAAGETTVQFTFSFANVSTNLVTILTVRPLCSYATAQVPYLPWNFHPGETGKIGLNVNVAGKSGTLIRGLEVTTDKGAKMLLFKIVMPQAAKAEKKRAHDLAAARKDPQAIFKNECADCHVKPSVGKFGAKLYDTACGLCHDSAQRADIVPDLHAISHPADLEFWRNWIEHGKAGTLMPGFSTSDGGPLTDNQIKSLTNYLAKATSSK